MNYTKITQFEISEGFFQIIIIVELQVVLTQPPDYCEVKLGVVFSQLFGVDRR